MSEQSAESDAGLYATSASLVRSDLRRLDDEVRPWRPSDGDSRCQECGHTYVPWFTDNWLWNHAVGGPTCTSDPGGYLCPRCFMVLAEQAFPGLVWRMFPEWSPTRDLPPDGGRA
jgi:hypothetical protein